MLKTCFSICLLRLLSIQIPNNKEMFSFTIVARGKTILASYSPDGTDLTREMQKLLGTPFVKNEQRRMNRYIYTFLHKNNLTFISASQADENISTSLKYLDTLADKWVLNLGDKSKIAPAFSMSEDGRGIFQSVIQEIESTSKTEKIKRDLEKTQRMVQDSVEMALVRGGELQSLSSKAEDLLSTSNEFKNQATNLKKTMQCAYYKSKIIYIIAIIAIIYFILTFICGGLSLKRCIPSSKD